jgi:hypothetical protein
MSITDKITAARTTFAAVVAELDAMLAETPDADAATVAFYTRAKALVTAAFDRASTADESLVRAALAGKRWDAAAWEALLMDGGDHALLHWSRLAAV